MFSSRYNVGSRLIERDGHRIAYGSDAWTGRDVVLKTAPTTLALREARCLLALPHGVAPRLVDLIGRGSEHSTLVVERLEGSTLREAAAELSPEHLPLIARTICQCLAEVHRTGWLHADIKPENIFLPRAAEETDVRLLDLGFAIDLFGAPDIDDRGGTPPYTAPELLKGWIVDGRADLYSLGVVLEGILPEHGRDSRWEPILEKLLQEVPGKRPASAVALRDEIDQAFGLVGIPHRHPRFGAGPMRGRAAELAFIRDCAVPGGRVLIQARPGTGLSRFLGEAVIDIAAGGGLLVRAIDLGEIRSGEGLDRALESLGRSVHGPEVVLCGIPDPSPGLRWIQEPIRSALSQLVSRPEWQRLSLPPLDVASYREIINASMGAVDPVGDGLSWELHDRTEGDLPRAAEGFLHAVRGGGSENGLRWKFDRDAAYGALALWNPDAIPPALTQVPSFLIDPLRVCSRAGRSFPADLAHALCDRFGESEAISNLENYGFLIAQGEDRLKFVTASLWRQAFAADPSLVREVDGWLNERFEPSPEQVGDILQACALARRSGRGAKESDLLSSALASAVAQRRHRDVLALFAYPDPPPPVWTAEAAFRHLAGLKTILGPKASEDWLLAVAGGAIRSIDVPLGVQLMERSASTNDPKAGVYALCMLAERSADQTGSPLFDRYLDALRRWEGVPEGTPPGVVDYLMALREFATGHAAEAEDSARRATRKLRGTGHIFEALSQQMNAVIQFARAPEEATAAMRSAIEVAGDPETEAQLRYNLAIMYDRIGMPERGLDCTEPGIRRLLGGANPARINYLRTQRCHELVLLDRIDEAQEEILALLSLPSNRFMPIRLVSLRSDLSFCHLHRGNERESLRQAEMTVTAAAQGAPNKLIWGAAADLVDVLVDLERHERIREHLPTLRELPVGGDASTRIAAARVELVRAQEDGDIEEAARHLEATMSDGREFIYPLERARALHQLGSVLLSQGTPGRDPAFLDLARGHFEEEIAGLPSTGYGYYRARARLALGRTLYMAGDRDGAIDILTEAIDLARDLKCLRLLALGLQARARADMDAL
jgi:serine/threonine protein kinase/tetratricopeptide (TPR) repeat protein